MNTMQHMKDPAVGVVPQLLPHLHLVSKYRYPINYNPSLETIVGYLIEAQKIMRDLQPVQWQMLPTPPDGTILLTWQPLEHLGTSFASDGYVWADPEQAFTSDIRGYKLEIFLHRSGFRLGEQVASHCRKRYRLLPGNAGMGLPTPDPSFWIIHYSKAAPRDHIPTASIPVHPTITQSLNQRRMIEQQGALARKEFMLHDRANWPSINLPRSTGQPSHRSRPSMGVPPGDPTIEEEEDVSRGDVLDFTTPRDISKMRYEQHHEWMEEVLGSAYATNKIIPTSLGLGRKGKLEDLTSGFFDAPTSVLHGTEANVQAARVGRMGPGKAEEFAERATQKIAHMEVELEKMKAKHEKRMAKLQKTTLLADAEKRLRTAATSPGEQTSANGMERETIDDIVAEVEAAFGRKIIPISNVVLVERGGLQENVPNTAGGTAGLPRSMTSPTLADPPTAAMPNVSNTGTEMQLDGSSEHPPTQPALPLPDTTQAAPAVNAPTDKLMAQIRDASADQPGTSTAVVGDIPSSALPAAAAVEPLDQDVEMTTGNEIQDKLAEGDFEGSEWVMVDENTNLPAQLTNDNDLAQDGTPQVTQQEPAISGEGVMPLLHMEQELSTEPITAAAEGEAGPEIGDGDGDDDGTGLDTGDFDLPGDFDHVDINTAGEAMDYGETDNAQDLDLDTMDDSAFGNAFHPPDESNILDEGSIS